MRGAACARNEVVLDFRPVSSFGICAGQLQRLTGVVLKNVRPILRVARR